MSFTQDDPQLLKRERAEIEHVIENYVEGYLTADPQTLLKAFHPEARLLTVEARALHRTDMVDWLNNLEIRRQKGDIREAKTQILDVDIAGAAAVAKVKFTFPRFTFTDYLSLLRLNDGWLIVNKIYSTH